MTEAKTKKRIINKKSERITNLEDRYFVVYQGPGVFKRGGLILEQHVVNEVTAQDFRWVKDQWLVYPVYLNRVKL